MFSSEITPNYSKVGSWNSGFPNFLIGTAYIGWCQVNSHVQVVQNVYGKWGRGCLRPQKNRRPIVRSISMQPTFYIPHLNHYTPNFSGIPLEWCHLLDIQPLQKSGNPDSCLPKQALFDLFFGTKSIFLTKWSNFAYSMSYINSESYDTF